MFIEYSPVKGGFPPLFAVCNGKQKRSVHTAEIITYRDRRTPFRHEGQKLPDAAAAFHAGGKRRSCAYPGMQALHPHLLKAGRRQLPQMPLQRMSAPQLHAHRACPLSTGDNPIVA